MPRDEYLLSQTLYSLVLLISLSASPPSHHSLTSLCILLAESEQISKTKEESGGERRMREAAVMGSKVTAGE